MLREYLAREHNTGVKSQYSASFHPQEGAMNLATSFRKNVAAVSMAAGAVLLANAAFSLKPAQAIEGLPAHCTKKATTVEKLNCGSAFYKKMEADEKAKLKAIQNRRVDSINDSTRCIENVAGKIKQAGSLSNDQKAAFKAQVLACG